MKVTVKKITLLVIATFAFAGITKAESEISEIKEASKLTKRSRWVGAERGASALIGLSSLLIAAGMVADNDNAYRIGIAGVTLSAGLNFLVNSAVAASNNKKRKKALLKAVKSGVLVYLIYMQSDDKLLEDSKINGLDSHYYVLSIILMLKKGTEGLYDLHDLVKYGYSELE